MNSALATIFQTLKTTPIHTNAILSYYININGIGNNNIINKFKYIDCIHLPQIQLNLKHINRSKLSVAL